MGDRLPFSCFTTAVLLWGLLSVLPASAAGPGPSGPGRKAVRPGVSLGTVRFLELFFRHPEVSRRFDLKRLRFKVDDKIDGLAEMTAMHEKLSVQLKDVETEFVAEIAGIKESLRKEKYSDPLASNVQQDKDAVVSARELEERYWKTRMSLEKRISEFSRALTYGLDQEDAGRRRAEALLNGEVLREVVSDVLGAIQRVSTRRQLSAVLNDDPFLWAGNPAPPSAGPGQANPYGDFLEAPAAAGDNQALRRWMNMKRSVFSKVPGGVNPGAILSFHYDITEEVAAEIAAGSDTSNEAADNRVEEE